MPWLIPAANVPEESSAEYDVIDGNWLVCRRCWATVWFRYMALHSEWHQGPADEDVEKSPQ